MFSVKVAEETWFKVYKEHRKKKNFSEEDAIKLTIKEMLKYFDSFDRK